MTGHQPTVTAIQRQERRRRYNVFVDGRFALALSADVLAAAGLHEGDPLPPERAWELERTELRHRTLESALRLLSYRPRSEGELRDRLRRKGLPADLVDETVAWLRERRYLDDGEFARFWTESRHAYGVHRIRGELRRKGVDRETVQEALAAHDEVAAAARAAERKARTIPATDRQTFTARLGGYLQRRGFSYAVSKAVVDRLWRERQGRA
ncbi:MAG TPA: RecX family transcriptional regulator [Dehalococcoidia bacterium]